MTARRSIVAPSVCVAAAVALVSSGLAALAPAAYAGTRDLKGRIDVVSTSLNGGLGDADSSLRSTTSWSPDGRRVAFVSAADNLVDDDTNGKADIFVKDLRTSAITRVSVSASGRQANGDCYGPTWSPDGKRLAFLSIASNLTPGDTNGHYDIFVKTLATRAIRLASRAPGGPANSDASQAWWSPDGRQLAFVSYASNLVGGDTNGEPDVFVVGSAGGVPRRVSTSSKGTQALAASFDAAWSPDGQQLAFSSMAANLTSGDTNNTTDIFVKRLSTGVVRRVSVDLRGRLADGGSALPAWSPDGTTLAFQSDATNLVPGDTNGTRDVFVKTLSTGQIRRVSTTSIGGQTKTGRSESGAWSPDATRLAFVSESPDLVPGDTNTAFDVFVKDLRTGIVTRVSTSVAGTQGNDYSYEAVWTPDGSRIAFTSAASDLVEGDTNASQDVFIKTVGRALPVVGSALVVGTARVGARLTCRATVSGSSRTTYAWLRGTRAIARAAAATYVPVRADVGAKISCRVTAQSPGGVIRRTSPLTAVVKAR